MLSVTRRQSILRLLDEKQMLGVRELSDRLGVTEETIRRDLRHLQEAGHLKRVHGGAVAPDRVTLDLAIDEPVSLNAAERSAIAEVAAQLVKDGETIFLDASPTVLAMCGPLRSRRNLNVLTNSLRIVMELARSSDMNVVCTGGNLRKEELSFVGPVAEATIRRFHADKTFLSCRGISLEYGLTDFSELTSAVKRAMLDASTVRIALIDSSKFDRASFIKIIDVSGVDLIITDSRIHDSVMSWCPRDKLVIAEVRGSQ